MLTYLDILTCASVKEFGMLSKRLAKSCSQYSIERNMLKRKTKPSEITAEALLGSNKTNAEERH